MENTNMIPSIPEWGKTDYTSGTAPFEWLYQYKDNKFILAQLKERIKEKAGAVGVKNFVALWNAYLSVMKSQQGVTDDNVTAFDGQSMELKCGEYVCDDFGIRATDKFGFEIQVCNHPIMPIMRLINIDSEEMKLEIAFKRGKTWRKMIVDRNALASSQKIIELSKYGISVDSENAKHLVKFFTVLCDMNYESIPEQNSVSRLGWIKDYGFSPYVDGLKFDGDVKERIAFEAIKEKGSYDVWLSEMKKIRQRNNTVQKIVFSASFSSVLVEPCNALPFFVHLWGGTESGKTVSTMVAASVWGNPRSGEYMRTFNATDVGNEISAGFYNSMPMFLDELQIVKDKKTFDTFIYMLTEGVGRIRGAKTGGLQKMHTWRNCIITTGEQPITNANSGGGAVNRIVEIDCKGIKIIENPVETVSIILNNHGYAGKQFVETLMSDDNMEYARKVQKEFYEKLCNGKATEKQAMSGSLILTADRLINEWIFKDDCLLEISEIEEFLSTKEQIDVNKRALEYIYDTIAVNANKFHSSSFDALNGEIWGVVDDDCTYIVKSQFDRIMQNEGYNETAFLSWAKSKDLLITGVGRTTTTKRVAGNVCRCICLRNLEEDKFTYSTEKLPF